jgi:hypothetical protein
MENEINTLKKEFLLNKINADLYFNAGGMNYLANELLRENSKILVKIKQVFVKNGKITGRDDDYALSQIENQIVYDFAFEPSGEAFNN